VTSWLDFGLGFVAAFAALFAALWAERFSALRRRRRNFGVRRK